MKNLSNLPVGSHKPDNFTGVAANRFVAGQERVRANCRKGYYASASLEALKTQP